MKALFASADFGTVGLLFFFVVFMSIAVWAYAPHRKSKIEQHKFIPLDDEDTTHDRS